MYSNKLSLVVSIRNQKKLMAQSSKLKTQKKGKLIIFSAPSGAGKTTIVKHLLQQNFNLEFSISATSREARQTETNGKDYYFLSEKEFQAREQREKWGTIIDGKEKKSLMQKKWDISPM